MSEKGLIELDTKHLETLSPGQKKTIVTNTLREAGFSQSQVARLLGFSKQYANKLEKQRKKSSLIPMVNLAKKAVKKTLKGEAIGDATPPKASDVMQAAKMVMDRAEPVIQKVENTKTVTFDLKQEDRERYLKALGLDYKAIEAEYEVVEPKLLEAPQEELE